MGWEFYDEATPKGRKDYECRWCTEIIPKGEKHLHYWGKFDGDLQDTRMHLECKDAMHRFMGGWDDALPDERMQRGGTEPWIPEDMREDMATVDCPDCDSKNVLDGTWRWNGEAWEHRCHGVHPQVGHWVPERGTEGDK